MARENVSEPTTPSDCSEESNRIDVTCPQCGTQWTCESGDPTCPDCEAAFSVRVSEEFALVERSGWTVAVSLASPDRQGILGDG